MNKVSGSARKRRLGFQALERRELLAAHISELLVDPLFGNKDTEQLVELRGKPFEVMEAGTYLTIIEESGFNAGEVHGIFDLSGVQFGPNGYLVLLPFNSPHQAHPDSNVLRSTETGFGGLPGDIYSDSHPISERIDFIIGANTYALIQSDVPPQLEQDIDADGDGLIDRGILEQWDILDSISLHPFVAADPLLTEMLFTLKSERAQTRSPSLTVYRSLTPKVLDMQPELVNQRAAGQVTG